MAMITQLTPTSATVVIAMRNNTRNTRKLKACIRDWDFAIAIKQQLTDYVELTVSSTTPYSDAQMLEEYLGRCLPNFRRKISVESIRDNKLLWLQEETRKIEAELMEY